MQFWRRITTPLALALGVCLLSPPSWPQLAQDSLWWLTWRAWQMQFPPSQPVFEHSGGGIPVDVEYLNKAIKLDKAWWDFVTSLFACDEKAAKEGRREMCRPLMGEINVQLWKKVREQSKDFFELGEKGDSKCHD